MQLHIVEELATRLRNRSSIYYSQDDYNGILPSIESQRVSLATDDIHLMWSLFDYASISGAATVARPPAESSLAETAGDNISDPSRHPLSSERSSTANLNGDFSESVPTIGILQPTDAPPSGADSTLFDPEAFSDLPEEWILDDWTLFGAPLSAYHSGFES